MSEKSKVSEHSDKLVARGRPVIVIREVTPLQRNWSLALLFAIGVLNYFDRQIINILAQHIKIDLGISDLRLGLLTGTAYGIFFTTLGIPLGRLADRVDRVKLIGTVLTIWSGFTVLCGAAASFMQLFMMRMGVGVGEAGALPASTALIRDIFPESRRASAMSILMSSLPVGGALGLLVGGYVGSTWGWRVAFIVAGIPGFFLVAVMLITMRDPKRYQLSGPGLRGRSASMLESLRAVASKARFRWILAGLTCSTFLSVAGSSWLPAFFIRVHGMTSAQFGLFGAIGIGVGGSIGAFGSGVLCDVLRKHIGDVEIKAVIVMVGVGILTLLATVFSADRAIALMSMFLFDLCVFAMMALGVILIQRESPQDAIALAFAVSMAVSNLVNLSVGVPMVGLVSDSLKASFGPSAIGYALAFCVTTVGMIAMLFYWRGRPRHPYVVAPVE